MFKSIFDFIKSTFRLLELLFKFWIVQPVGIFFYALKYLWQILNGDVDPPVPHNERHDDRDSYEHWGYEDDPMDDIY